MADSTIIACDVVGEIKDVCSTLKVARECGHDVSIVIDDKVNKSFAVSYMSRMQVIELMKLLADSLK